jgi:putative endonuclease
MDAPHLLQGRLGERIACHYLMRRGFDILARRHRTGAGEIDLIALEDDILVFVEVKTRASRQFGDPWEFVDWQKQQRIRRTAEDFIARYNLQYTYRFDIVSVISPGTARQEITLFRNAF